MLSGRPFNGARKRRIDMRGKGRIDMRRKGMWIGLLTAVIALTALFTGKARATTAVGFTSTTMAMSRFGGVELFNQQVPLTGSTNIWLSWQKTIGASDVYVLNNTWPVGSDTGWHSHPGATWIIVTSGTITEYEGGDPTCKPTVYTQGMGFTDPGGDHIHIVRNEGPVPATAVAFRVIAAGASARIDQPSPGNCPF
jgi:Cupin domain